ncbi:MAG: cytochrome c oxidase assembly protein [Acidobacteriota bacterium]|nr:cytochrome c oxidase assembly protein [Acidobacteriota bacterium]
MTAADGVAFFSGVQTVFSGVQTGGLALAADALQVLAAAVYLGGVGRLARKGRRWSRSSTACFLSGVGLLWLAVGSGLAAHDEQPTVHVVQHALLMMVAPPLLLLGRPVTLAVQASRRPAQVRMVKVVHSRVLRHLTNPLLGWLLYYGSMGAMLADRQVYDYLLTHPLAHDGSHLLLVVVGSLYWQPLLDADPSPWRLSPRLRLGSALAGAGVETLLGVLILAGAGAVTAGAVPAGAAFLAVALPTCGACCPALASSRGRRGRRRARRRTWTRPAPTG